MPGSGSVVGERGVGRRLNSWKEVATYFQRDERTVKRWESSRGLPIHRVPGRARSKIYAYAQELDAWFDAGLEAPAAPATPDGGAPEELAAPARSAEARRRWPWAVLLVVLCAVGLGVFSGPWIAAKRTERAQRLTSHNVRAIELYREGWHDWNSRTPVGLAHAQAEFQQALALDPDFAQARVGLANTYLLLREYAGMPDAVAYPLAEASVRRALALAPDLADAHSALGFIDYWWRWDPRSAEAELRRAIALSPSSIDARLWLAGILKVQLRGAEALDQINRAQALDPNSSTILETRGDILMSNNDMAEGHAILVHLEEVDPSEMWPHAVLAKQALVEGRYTTYLDEAQKVADLKGDAGQKDLLAAAQQGWRAGGGGGLLDRLLERQKAMAAAGRASDYDVACTYMLQHRPDDAVAWLHRATDAHDAMVLGTFNDPCFKPLAKDPRLQFLHGIVFGR
jgi:tetratricopeptide (TPR) repeat protein